MQGLANATLIGGFLCSGLLRVAPFCARGGVRVVSISPLLSGCGVHPKLVQLVQHLLGHASLTMTLDRYSH